MSKRYTLLVVVLLMVTPGWLRTHLLPAAVEASPAASPQAISPAARDTAAALR